MAKIKTITLRQDFLLLKKKPIFYSSSNLLCKCINKNDRKFGFIITKKIGGAVQRNLIRRRLKGALMIYLKNISEHKYFLFICRKNIVNLDFADLALEIGKIIHSIPE